MTEVQELTVAVDVHLDDDREPNEGDAERMPCSHWPGQARCGVCGMGLQPDEKRWYA